jgi:triphosphoribosyl-dephospho-CoA synthase
VSPISSGSDKDMNFFTFINSSVVLYPYMLKFAKKSFCGDKPETIFENIRKTGKYAENAMFNKTDNVNTHKGMIFSLGLCVSAAAKSLYEGYYFSNIRNIIKDMTYGLLEKKLYEINKKNIENENGETVFLKFPHTGLIGEAEMGFLTIFNIALSVYEGCDDLNENDRLLQTLITIMQYAEDSTILYRHSKDVLKEVQGLSKYIIEMGGIYSEKGRKNIVLISKQFENKNISPRESADLLTCTVFLSKVKKAYFC